MIKVLLIDHSLGHPQSAATLMKGLAGFECESVSSYSQILTAFRKNRHDVCVIDSAVNNGPRLFNQARSVGCYLPVIMITSHGAEEAVLAMRSGVADCLFREELTPAKIAQSVCIVAERSRTSLRQAQRERRYLALLENVPVMVYSHDVRGKLTSMNRVGERMMGYSETEMLRMNVSEIIVQKYQAVVWEMVARTLDAQSKVDNDVELITKQKETLPVRLTTHPIQLDGTTTEIQAIARPSPLLSKSHGDKPLNMASSFVDMSSSPISSLMFL